ncbi:DUF4386 domain-containing protein [Nonomuraea basaltis]|uniref:DUF4386 domain-containing protein n=1 Tax=Nonomuraea basaltis TaxID=2495887 RepID=UPI00110C532C|nr:DUF4386 domain-containing protein [Nonomuraea basaltis]TMR99871.1 DUF4386 domain-containing protein [Nonomuraea basaltis]
MTAGTLDAAPARLARITGGLLLVIAASALFAEFFVRSTLVIPGDAPATARAIQASPQLFRLGFLGYLLAFVCDLPVAVLFYVLLRPVNRTLALMAASFRLVYTAIVAAALLPYAGAMILLGGTGYLSAVGTDQRHALALFNLDLFTHGFGAALVFFGVHLGLLGWLLFRSRRIPAVLGILVSLGGLAYVIDGITRFIAPSLHATIVPVLGTLGMAELVLAIWLVTKGMRPGAPDPTGP